MLCYRRVNRTAMRSIIIVRTLPAPTGPITATSRPGLTVRLTFLREYLLWELNHLAEAFDMTIPKLLECTLSCTPSVLLDEGLLLLWIPFWSVVVFSDSDVFVPWSSFSSYSKKFWKHKKRNATPCIVYTIFL